MSDLPIRTTYTSEIRLFIHKRFDLNTQGIEKELEYLNQKDKRPQPNYIILNREYFERSTKSTPNYYKFDKKDKCYRDPIGRQIRII